MNQTTCTYTAAVATASDVVSGNYCDVTVLEDELYGYKDGERGEAVPVYGVGDKAAMQTVETDVLVTDPDVGTKAGSAADEILRRAGWVRTDDWTVTHNALYATVKRA